jgi:SAM-dependent methyltransferase
MRQESKRLLDNTPIRWETREEMYADLRALGEIPNRSVGVEVGVCAGENAKALDSAFEPEDFYLVDAWTAFPIEGSDVPRESEQREYDEGYKKVLGWAKKTGTKILKTWSSRATYAFRNASLDWVYIDADHHYPPVLCDLLMYEPKVKDGGIIMCHDFTRKISMGAVVDAVEEFVRDRYKYKLLGRTNDKYPSVAIKKAGGLNNYKQFVRAGHLGGNVARGDPSGCETRIWEWLKRRFALKTVLDVGCGVGNFLKQFEDLGYKPLGLEGLWQNCIAYPTHPIIEWDITNGPLRISDIDLVWCVEVVEHIVEDYVDSVLDILCLGKVVAMTHGLPGQPGYHHVNLQPPEYWIEKMRARGYNQIPRDDYAVLIDGPYFESGGLIFVRRT